MRSSMRDATWTSATVSLRRRRIVLTALREFSNGGRSSLIRPASGPDLAGILAPRSAGGELPCCSPPPLCRGLGEDSYSHCPTWFKIWMGKGSDGWSWFYFLASTYRRGRGTPSAASHLRSRARDGAFPQESRLNSCCQNALVEWQKQVMMTTLDQFDRQARND